MMGDECTVSIAADFSITPGSRYRSEGEFSGEEFRDLILEPRYMEAVRTGKKLLINFDGVIGYATSFLEEAFGGLARKYGKAALAVLEFRCVEEPSLEREVMGYMRDALQS